MNKIFLIFFLVFAVSTTVKSQHCGWDYCRVIILDVRDSLTNKIINDLYIILTDSNGKPYTSKENLDNYKETSIYQNTDTLQFGQNNGNNFPKHGAYNIPFGVNSYMLLVHYNYLGFNRSGKDRIFIRDNKNRYKSVSIIFEENKIASMCKKNPIWHDEKTLDETTIKVKLKRK